MSERPEEVDDLELQALQRELDGAFESTRPRPGFEDQLWLQVQDSRPPQRRFGDVIYGLFQGIREVPAVPMAAVAAALVVVLGVGIFAYSGLGRGGGGGGAAQGVSSEANAPRNGTLFAGNFGRLPTPVFNNGTKNGQAPAATVDTAAGQYYGPAQLTWTGKFDLAIVTAPVFRYAEPSTNAADQFASGLGAVLRERPSGFLGSYSASDYTLKVRGTVQAPPASPAFFIFSSSSMQTIDAAGAGPRDLADIFLAQHSLSPQWSYTVSVDASGDPTRVYYERQLDAPGYGPVYLVDVNGQRYGLEVDLSANRPVLCQGVLPVSLDVADYKIISAAEAIQAALASAGPAAAATAAPAIKLTKAELVYVLAPAGDHSFYEPAILFTGTFQMNGSTLTRRVLVPAVDPSQRKP